MSNIGPNRRRRINMGPLAATLLTLYAPVYEALRAWGIKGELERRVSALLDEYLDSMPNGEIQRCVGALEITIEPPQVRGRTSYTIITITNKLVPERAPFPATRAFQHRTVMGRSSFRLVG